MIEVIDLTKKFNKKTAIDNISLLFDKGVYGLLGPNGAGKTTLMRSILGLYRLQKGDVLFDGISIKKSYTFSKSVGYLPQKFGLFRELTVLEMMAYLATIKGIDKSKQLKDIEKCVEQVNLSDRLADKVASLSGGMIRRLGIAQALLGNPKVVIVDEPTAGLDPEERARFKNLIAQIKDEKIIILSTHIVEDVEALCNNIVIIDNGKVLGKGNSSDVCNYALNKVYYIPANQEDNLVGNFFIEKREQKNGENMLRVLSDTKQCGSVLEPSIEDGYICRIKGLG